MLRTKGFVGPDAKTSRVLLADGILTAKAN
jgi:hypothetical protein